MNTATAAHETHRQEHGDDGERGGDHGQTDLVRCIEGRLEPTLAHPHVTHDVLNLDDGIIDEHARHQRQTEQRDLV